MPLPDDVAPEREPLSLDEAIEMLLGPGARRDDDADDAEAGAPDPAASCSAPSFWSDEDKADFDRLPAPLQQKVAAYEHGRHLAATRVIQAASEAGRQADAHAAQAADLTARLGAVVPQLETIMAGRWGAAEPNWIQVAQVHGPQAAQQLKAAFDQDQAHLRLLHGARRGAEARLQAHRLVNEHKALGRMAPELTHPQHGKARRAAVARFLVDNGVHPTRLGDLGALEVAMAYDALRYRLANAALAQSNRQPPASVRSGLAPAAAQPVRSLNKRQAEASKARFARKPSIDNAVAALLSRR